MYTIRKEFWFEAAHILDGMPPGHKCGSLHGHSYKVELFLSAKELNKVGFVVDFGDLVEFKNFIDSELDHKVLNDVLDFNPTAENIAEYLYGYAVNMYPVSKVRVWETAKCYGEYTDE